MITLYGFGPAFGLPDPSPFVTKAEVLLKMAGLAYAVETGGLGKAPKGKLPYIVDDGETIADSTFIRWHLEKQVPHRFRPRPYREQRAVAWAFEKMLEDNLYWAVVARPLDGRRQLREGPRNFFRAVPAPVRPLVAAMIRRQVRRRCTARAWGGIRRKRSHRSRRGRSTRPPIFSAPSRT